MPSLSDFLKSARSFVGDGPTDNLSRLESLNNPDEAGAGVGIINSTNKLFVTENFPIVSVDIVWVDNAVVPPNGYDLDSDTGTIIFLTAPTLSAFISYYYYLMTDDAWTSFVHDGLSRMDIGTGDPEVDLPNVTDGLMSALTSYTCGSWARRLAGQSGLWYNQRLQERNEDRDTISKKFLQMSEAFLKDGDIARDDFYKGAGKQYQPAMQIVQHTPRQYTPER